MMYVISFMKTPPAKNHAFCDILFMEIMETTFWQILLQMR